MSKPDKFTSRTSAWSLLDELVFDFGVSRRRAAIVIIFAEAQRKRTRVKRSGVQARIRGV